jgi:hypothetical protein|tara:strand:- start:5487 stop:5972 length:486 start_codon:yes stop_codon:yes gene_type:complete
MAYIYPAPGVTGSEVTLTLTDTSASPLTGNLVLAALQDVTVNNANDVFTWTQLDETAKLQVATTSTNSLAMNIVLNQTTFFGAPATNPSVTMADAGIIGLSTQKVLVDFDLFLGKTDGGAGGTTMSGKGYITGLAPTVSADAPVWVSPITITVDGEYTITQ